MKKLIVFLSLVLLTAAGAYAQLYCQVGAESCASTTQYLPAHLFYGFTESQYVIPAEEMADCFPGTGTTDIMEIGWYHCSGVIGANQLLNVYFYEATTPCDPAVCTTRYPNGVQVVTGQAIPIAAAPGWRMIPLDAPYTFTHGNCLVVSVCEYQPGYNATVYWARNAQTGNGYSRYKDATPAYDCDLTTQDSTGTQQCANGWLSTRFLIDVTPVNLTMLAPGGTGIGSVSPAVGVHGYPVNGTANLLATPQLFNDFDYWEVDGIWYSANATETLLMDTDHTVQAFFSPMSPEPVPHTSTFETGLDGWAVCNRWVRSDFSTVTQLTTMPCTGTYGMYYQGLYSLGTHSLMVKQYDISGCASGNQDVTLSFCYEMYRGFTNGALRVLAACGDPADYCNQANYTQVAIYNVDATTPVVSGTASLDLGELLLDCPVCETEGVITIAFSIENVTSGNHAGIDDVTVACGSTCPTYADLTMLAPGGTGGGSVSPPVGVTGYIVNDTATLVATPSFGSSFSYWEVDGSWYSANATESLLMDANHTAQAFFDLESILYFEDFAVDPGWTLDTGWEWGAATASVGCGGLTQDPAVDSTGEGNILGYEIGGCYTNSMTTTVYATSPVLDFTGYIDVQMGFERWLGVESATFDHASIDVFDGAAWNQVWNHTGASVADTAWNTRIVDISDYADNNPNVQIRFGMGPTDSSVVYCGWNIDAIGFVGSQPGFIDGYVTSDGGTNPVIGATVSVDGTGASAVSQGPDGYYLIAIGDGTYDMTVTAPGFNDAAASGVTVVVGNTTTQNFDLTYPEIDVSPLSHTVTLVQPDTTTRTVTIANTGTGPLDFSIGFTNFTEAKGGKALWDMLAHYSVETLVSDNMLLGCEFMNGSLWVTGAAGNSAAAPNYLYEISQDGTTLLNTYNQAATAAADWGYRDLATDGTYLYAGCGTRFYQIDPTDGSVVADITHTLGIVIRALAYNPASGTFFTGDFSSTIREFSFNGTAVTQIRAFTLGLTGVYGMAWDDVSTGGPFLWIFDQSGTPASTLVQANVNTPGSEVLTGVTHTIPLLTGLTDQIAGGLFFTTDFITGKILLGALLQGTATDEFVAIELGDYATWASVVPNSGTVPGGGSTDVTVNFDSTAVAGVGTYTCDMLIASNDGDENPVTVDLTMIVIDVTPTPTGPTPTPGPIPATGSAGVGLLLLAIGALMSLAGLHRK